jgi:hypothetical protein
MPCWAHEGEDRKVFSFFVFIFDKIRRLSGQKLIVYFTLNKNLHKRQKNETYEDSHFYRPFF